jgi:hypothetical protein
MYCRECLKELKRMYKDKNIPALELVKFTKVYQKWSWYRTEVRSGWYYKIQNKEFGIYDSKRAAEASLLMRLKDYSWQE